jgi:hypothetical protein
MFYDLGEIYMQSDNFGFLPFVDQDIPFVDSINLMEILHAVCEEEDFKRALSLLVLSTFERHHAISALLIAPESELKSMRWKVTHQHGLRSTLPEDQLFSLKSNHKIVKLIEKARVTRAYLNGKETANDLLVSGKRNLDSDIQEDHGIICVPLIQNLEVRAGLIIVLEKQVEISGSDRALLAGLQAIFSYFYFKHRDETSSNFGMSEFSSVKKVLTRLSKEQKMIARLLLQGQSDEAICDELHLDREEFQEYYDTLCAFLFAQTREEVIQELRLMDLP